MRDMGLISVTEQLGWETKKTTRNLSTHTSNYVYETRIPAWIRIGCLPNKDLNN
jgi:hypothetical protein